MNIQSLIAEITELSVINIKVDEAVAERVHPVCQPHNPQIANREEKNPNAGKEAVSPMADALLSVRANLQSAIAGKEDLIKRLAL